MTIAQAKVIAAVTAEHQSNLVLTGWLENQNTKPVIYFDGGAVKIPLTPRQVYLFHSVLIQENKDLEASLTHS